MLALADVSFTIERANASASSANPDRARRRSARRSCAAVPMDVGEIIFHDRGQTTDLLTLDMRQMEPIRRKIQYIFQDPYSSLNPRMTVGSILAEPFVIHGIGTDVTRRAAAVRLLEMVGLGAQHLNRYPAQLFRRPAAAHRHRPRAGAAARSRDLRRAGIGARRLDPGADPQSP